MSQRKANMWRTSEPLDQRSPKLPPPRRVIGGPSPTRGENPVVATNIAEQRFGSRADKLLRRFSWEDGDDV